MDKVIHKKRFCNMCQELKTNTMKTGICIEGKWEKYIVCSECLFLKIWQREIFFSVSCKYFPLKEFFKIAFYITYTCLIGTLQVHMKISFEPCLVCFYL